MLRRGIGLSAVGALTFLICGILLALPDQTAILMIGILLLSAWLGLPILLARNPGTVYVLEHYLGTGKTFIIAPFILFVLATPFSLMFDTYILLLPVFLYFLIAYSQAWVMCLLRCKFNWYIIVLLMPLFFMFWCGLGTFIAAMLDKFTRCLGILPPC